MQPMFITGSLGRDAELKSTQNGDNILSFSVASNQGYGENKTTNWYRCTLWGKRGASIAQYLTKGTKVSVFGEFSTSEYEGKTQLNLRVYEVEWQRNDNAASGGPKPVANDSWGDTDLDSDVPF